jgi:hypothetical protein
MTEFYYRGYAVEVGGQGLASGKWVASVPVTWADTCSEQTCPLPYGQDRQLQTRDEVEALAFELAHAWIDRRGPILIRVSQT